MFAIRAARAFTGRPLIAKFERSYHGTHDGVMTGTPGVPEAMSGLVVELPWGDPDGIEAALRGREHELAAIIIEPVQGAGGVRAPEPGFLPFLRALAERLGALLIFDEIISFRRRAGRRPGAVRRPPGPDDARQDHRRRLPAGGVRWSRGRDGRSSTRGGPGAISHGGTFNGSPVAAAAGLATLRELTPDVYARLDDLGERLGDGSRRRSSAKASTRESRSSARSSRSSPGSGVTAFATGVAGGRRSSSACCSTGFYLAPRGMGAIPAIATEADVDELAAATGEALRALQRTPATATA